MSGEIIQITGFRAAQALITALANLKGIKAFMLGIQSTDTLFTYSIRTNQKVTKDIISFSTGMAEAFKTVNYQ